MDQPPGQYTLKIDVTDRVAGVTRAVTRTYPIVPKEFALVRLAVPCHPEAKVPVGFLPTSKLSWIHFTAVGFGRDGATKQPNLMVTMQVLDDKGQAVLAKPSSGTIN